MAKSKAVTFVSDPSLTASYDKGRVTIQVGEEKYEFHHRRELSNFLHHLTDMHNMMMSDLAAHFHNVEEYPKEDI